MYSVRKGRVDDIRHISDLAQELLGKSAYAGIPFDEVKFKRLTAMLMGSRNGCVLVVADLSCNDKPVGFIIGMADDLFFSRKKYVTDLCVYVKPEARAYGAFLARRFVRWGKRQHGVAEITMGISSGMGDVDRVGRMYERMGFTRVGGMFSMRTDGVEDTEDNQAVAMTAGGC